MMNTKLLHIATTRSGIMLFMPKAVSTKVEATQPIAAQMFMRLSNLTRRTSGRAASHAADACARSGASSIQRPTGFPVVGYRDQVSRITGLAGARFDFL